MQQLMFHIGLTTVGLVGVFVVPLLGWQWLFVLGGLTGAACLADDQSPPGIAELARQPGPR